MTERSTTPDRSQVRPATEGWSQQLDAEGRPTLQFASPRRKQPETHLADLDLAARKARMLELGQPAFRATQLSNHYFARYTTDPAEMSDLPAEGREELVAAMLPPLLTEVRRLRTDKGETIKFLWRLFDGAMVESVLMRYPGRVTLCVSSQAGCGMNCPFCATDRRASHATFRRPRSSTRSSRPIGPSPVASSAGCAGTADTTPSASPTSCSWEWASRSPTTRV